MFDNCLEMLVLSGRSLPHAMMMMIPEPWENHESMSDEKARVLSIPQRARWNRGMVRHRWRSQDGRVSSAPRWIVMACVRRGTT
jgi:hypothetical protein